MPQEPKLLDQVCAAIRVRHYSIRTEKAYVSWIRRFILFQDNRGQTTVLHQRADPIPIRCGPDAGAGRNPGIPASRPTLSPDSASLDPGYIGR